MKNILILFLLFVCSFNAKSQDEFSEEKTPAERLLELKEKYDKKEKEKKDNSWFFLYYSLGKSIDEINKEKFTGNSSSFGYKKMKERYMQGYEYNVVSQTEKYKIENYKLTFGYKPKFKFKYEPYLEYHFGFSNYENLETNKSAFGYLHVLELGFFIKRFLPIHIIGGTRMTFINYDKDEIDTIKSQELFLRLGFEF